MKFIFFSFCFIVFALMLTRFVSIEHSAQVKMAGNSVLGKSDSRGAGSVDGAREPAREESASNLGPTRLENGAIRFTVQGDFRGSKSAARESALLEAREQIRGWLLRQEPPIKHAPSLEAIQHMLRPENAPPQEEPLKSGMMYKMTISVDLTPLDIRTLRSRDRTVTGFWALCGLMAIFGVTALVYRIDEWTKGYLTRWLIGGGMAVLALVLGLFWYLR